MWKPCLALFGIASVLGGAGERDWEARFRTIPESQRIRQYVEKMSARPHHLGSPYGKEVAEWLRTQFREWGWNAEIETFEVLFPTPQERVVELLAPLKFRAALAEPGVKEDPSSSRQSEHLPTYNAYSIDGDVTAPLVYVNYGIPEDYERLERMGISVKGAIVIARYGASWRGIKPKLAAEKGAIGCLIYSDPADDGYAQGDVFPQGPWRPRDGVQRGSVMDMPLHPGDPLTPGHGSTSGAQRLPLKDAPTLTKIPVLPISYADAQPLLAAIGGRVAPAEWRGSLPITYKIGPGPARVRLHVKSSWDMVKLYNVIARIPGSEYPDEWVLRGNHHDAWVIGTQDPVSGAAAMLEEARAMGVLLREGWRPKRTIIYCAWDGEEQGLIGSTEWVETHADELRRKGVAYINSDSNSAGVLRALGSHSLEAFINGVARDVSDPVKNMSVWKRLQLSRISNARGDDRKELRERPDLRIDALGSGSDYTAFIDHLGIASLDLRFSGEGEGGIYHSIYDDFYWYTKFSDSDFLYGWALAQTAGTAVMRLADAGLLPFKFTNFADTISKYAAEIEKLHKQKADDAAEINQQLTEGVFDAITNPRETLVPPARRQVPPDLDFAPVRKAIDSLHASAARFEAERSKVLPGDLKEVNRKLIETERLLTHADGLPSRPWYKHQIYAPGFYTGYGVKTIPGVREAIEQENWEQAKEQLARVTQLVGDLAKHLNDLASAIGQSSK